MKSITPVMITQEVSYRIIGRSATDGRLYHVSSDFKSLFKAMKYRKDYCGNCINDKNDTFAIVKMTPELLEV